MEPELVTRNQKLKSIREQIDRIDNIIITALAERMAFMNGIGEHKRTKRIPVYQPEREQTIINRLIEIGEKHNLRAEFIEELFSLIFDEAKRIQYEIINRIESI